MRFLVDQNLSPRLAAFLGEHGHDAVHTSGLGLEVAPDAAVLERARNDSRMLISATQTSGRSWHRHGQSGPRSSTSDGSKVDESSS